MILLVLSVLAAADTDVECTQEVWSVVPPHGAVDVPIDTVVRVEVDGEPCSSDPVSLRLVPDGGTAVELGDPSVQGSWRLFDAVALQPNTSYTAVFRHPDMADVEVGFATSADPATAPVTPEVELTLLHARQERGEVILYANVTATLADASGLTTAAFAPIDDQVFTEFGARDGTVGGHIEWTAAESPDRACVLGAAVSASQQYSDPVEACRDVDFVTEVGCTCSSITAGGSAGLLAVLGPLFVVVRRRRKRGMDRSNPPAHLAGER